MFYTMAINSEIERIKRRLREVAKVGYIEVEKYGLLSPLLFKRLGKGGRNCRTFGDICEVLIKDFDRHAKISERYIKTIESSFVESVDCTEIESELLGILIEYSECKIANCLDKFNQIPI